MRQRGFTLIEMSIVVFLILLLVAMAAPSLKAYTVEAHLLGAGYTFKSEFLKARSMALKQNVYTAIRREGTQKQVVDTMQTRMELYDVIGYHAYEQRLDALFAKNK